MSFRKTAIVASVCVALLSLVVMVGFSSHRKQATPRSQAITTVVDGNPQHQVLLPRLQRRTVVVPDRPYNPSDTFRPGEPPPDHVKRRRTFEVSTNSVGLRGPEVKLPAPRFRVICMGDSVTFGWGVSYEQTWCVQLSRLLPVDPVIAAWPAARPEHLLRWARDNARALDGDLLLFAWAPAADDHDLKRTLARLKQTARALAPMKVAWVLPPAGTFYPAKVAAAKELYPGLQGRAPLIPILNLTPRFRAQLPLPGVVGEFKGGRQRMIRLPGREVLVDVEAPPVHPIYGQLLSPVIIAAFESSPAIKEPLFWDQGHPDAAGFKVFAREVASWIRARGWLEQGRR